MIKRFGVLILLGILLVASVCIKVFGPKAEKAGEAAAPAVEVAAPGAVAREEPQNYFEAFRDDRQAVREKEMQYLDEIIATAAIDDETLAQAVEQKLALVESMEAEFAIESQIGAKGFADAAVTLHNGRVTVVVEAEKLSTEQVAQILDIVQAQTGASAKDVKVTTNLQ